MSSTYKILISLIVISILFIIFTNKFIVKESVDNNFPINSFFRIEIKKIAILIIHQGEFKIHEKLFFLSARQNMDYDFIFLLPRYPKFEFKLDLIHYNNIKFVMIENHPNFFVDRMYKAINQENHPSKNDWLERIKYDPKLLNGFKQFYGYIYESYFPEKFYTHFGWADTKMLFGNLPKFFTKDILDKNDIVSATDAKNLINFKNYFTIIKNNEFNRNLYRVCRDCVSNLLEGKKEASSSNSFSQAIIENTDLPFYFVSSSPFGVELKNFNILKWTKGHLFRYEDIGVLPFNKTFDPPILNLNRQGCERTIFKGYMSRSCFYIGYGAIDFFKNDNDPKMYATYSNFISELPFLRTSKLLNLKDQFFNISKDNNIYVKIDPEIDSLYVVSELE